MSNFSLLTAVQVVEKTMAYTMYRQFIWLGVCTAYLVAVVIGAGTVLALNAVGLKFTGLGTLGGIVGFAICAYFLHRARPGVFVPLRVGHAAVTVAHLQGSPLPGGMAQVEHAKSLVSARFKDNDALFALQNRVREGVENIVRDWFGISGTLPMPGGERVAAFVNGVVGNAFGFLDEVILAYSLKDAGKNPQAACGEGLILLAQNRAPMVRATLVLFAFMYIGLFATFYLLLVPASWVTDLFPVWVDYWGWAFAMVFAWGIKATFFESIAMAALVQVFFGVTEGQQPEPGWEQKLAGAAPWIAERFQEKDS